MRRVAKVVSSTVSAVVNVTVAIAHAAVAVAVVVVGRLRVACLFEG